MSWTPSELAFALAAAYQGTEGAQLQQLADYLGCHPEVRQTAWDAWRTELELTGQDVHHAGAWLDFDFWELTAVE